MEDAKETILFLMDCYKGTSGPFVYPIILKNGDNIGYVQVVPIENKWEIGYHIAKSYTGNGYATEAIRAFSPVIMEKLEIEKIEGICVTENIASCIVMEKTGFVLEYKGIGNYQGRDCTICQYSYFFL